MMNKKEALFWKQFSSLLFIKGNNKNLDTSSNRCKSHNTNNGYQKRIIVTLYLFVYFINE